MSGVEIRLRSDPHVIANPGDAIEPALNIGLIADENSAADLECFQVFESDPAADFHSVTKTSGNRAPNCASHQILQLGFAVIESRILREQLDGATRGSQIRG
jgi:hypothetical protein